MAFAWKRQKLEEEEALGSNLENRICKLSAALLEQSFGSDNHVRISYATSMENIVEGMKRLEAVLAR